MISKQKLKAFQKEILDWYSVHKRELPWRELPVDPVTKSRDPYKILISEVMAQQTQLSRVVPKYEAWMKKFPTVAHLANAKIPDVLRYWHGLGYNRRALHLKKTAEIIISNFKGEFPQTEKELIALPGIGKYTARAILCFAFEQQIAVVDTNVRKVIVTKFLSELRIKNYELRTNRKSKTLNSLFVIRDSTATEQIHETVIEEIATLLLPMGNAFEWNQALMDYAAVVLKKEKIPVPRQSKFIGSHRYYRGQILKVLLQKKSVHLKNLGKLIKKDYSAQEKEWLQKLVDELSQEGFILNTNNKITLMS